MDEYMVPVVMFVLSMFWHSSLYVQYITDSDPTLIPNVDASQVGEGTTMGPASVAINDDTDSFFGNGTCSVTGRNKFDYFNFILMNILAGVLLFGPYGMC